MPIPSPYALGDQSAEPLQQVDEHPACALVSEPEPGVEPLVRPELSEADIRSGSILVGLVSVGMPVVNIRIVSVRVR
jgi:hypothetical protein